jgi:tungstate transport system substrate-binding protein
MKKLWILLLVLSMILAVGCGDNNSTEDLGPADELILVTTTSTYDSGLLDYLLPYFEEKHNYDVKVISLGTGQALEQGKNGDADVALVHAKATELEMVEQGHFVDRKDVMYNDFVVVGPDDDSLGIKELSSINEVFTTLAENQAHLFPGVTTPEPTKKNFLYGRLLVLLRKAHGM